MPKLLIIGKDGYLGSHLFLSDRLRKSFDVVGAGRSSGLRFDLGRPETFGEIQEFLRVHSPQYMVITAAVSDVEKCARDPDTTRAMNVHGTQALLEIAREFNVTPVFFSTDYVFKPIDALRLLKEDDACEPLTEYGRQKRAVEEWITSRFSRYLIFRTSKLMGMEPQPRNILTQVTPHAFVDQWITPVFLEDIAEVLAHPELSKLSGIYHLATHTVYSRYELASLKGCEIIPTKISDVKTLERRPNYNTLDSSKIRSELGIRFREIAEVL